MRAVLCARALFRADRAGLSGPLGQGLKGRPGRRFCINGGLGVDNCRRGSGLRDRRFGLVRTRGRASYRRRCVLRCGGIVVCCLREFGGLASLVGGWCDTGSRGRSCTGGRGRRRMRRGSCRALNRTRSTSRGRKGRVRSRRGGAGRAVGPETREGRGCSRGCGRSRGRRTSQRDPCKGTNRRRDRG